MCTAMDHSTTYAETATPGVSAFCHTASARVPTCPGASPQDPAMLTQEVQITAFQSVLTSAEPQQLERVDSSDIEQAMAASAAGGGNCCPAADALVVSVFSVSMHCCVSVSSAAWRPFPGDAYSWQIHFEHYVVLPCSGKPCGRLAAQGGAAVCCGVAGRCRADAPRHEGPLEGQHPAPSWWNFQSGLSCGGSLSRSKHIAEQLFLKYLYCHNSDINPLPSPACARRWNTLRQSPPQRQAPGFSHAGAAE